MECPLHRAARLGNYIEVNRLLENRIDVDTMNSSGETALEIAVYNGDLSIVKLLLEHGANTEVCGLKKMCPLHVASECGNLEMVKLLKGFGADMNRKSQNGNYPIHFAVEAGDIHVIKYFLDNGVDHDTSLNNFGSSPLHKAAARGRKTVVEFLLELNIDINRKNFCQNTALYCAVEKGHTEIVKLLINYGADLNDKNYQDWTPLHAGAEQGHFDIVKLLFKNGAFCDLSKIYKSQTPLSLAIQTGKTDIVAYFLEQGANVESQSMNGYTLLHMAVQFGRKDIVKLLVEKGADIHSRIHNTGTTPLHYAADRVWPKIIDYLILKGANVTAKEINQNTPLDKILNAKFRPVVLEKQTLLCTQTLLKHMLLCDKETTLVYPPNYFNLQKPIEDFYTNCLKEIDLMNHYMIGDTTISLYTFLHDMFDESKLAMYLNNIVIKQEMKNPYNHIKHFPIYSNIHLLIEENVKRAINRQCLLTKAYAAINCFSAKLPLETKMNIFSYLNYNDLNNFVKSHELF